MNQLTIHGLQPFVLKMFFLIRSHNHQFSTLQIDIVKSNEITFSKDLFTDEGEYFFVIDYNTPNLGFIYVPLPLDSDIKDIYLANGDIQNLFKEKKYEN